MALIVSFQQKLLHPYLYLHSFELYKFKLALHKIFGKIAGAPSQEITVCSPHAVAVFYDTILVIAPYYVSLIARQKDYSVEGNRLGEKRKRQRERRERERGERLEMLQYSKSLLLSKIFARCRQTFSVMAFSCIFIKGKKVCHIIEISELPIIYQFRLKSLTSALSLSLCSVLRKKLVYPVS